MTNQTNKHVQKINGETYMVIDLKRGRIPPEGVFSAESPCERCALHNTQSCSYSICCAAFRSDGRSVRFERLDPTKITQPTVNDVVNNTIREKLKLARELSDQHRKLMSKQTKLLDEIEELIQSIK